MNDLTERLETMAERGWRRGSAALVDDVERELGGTATPWWRRPPALAVLGAAALVLVVVSVVSLLDDDEAVRVAAEGDDPVASTIETSAPSSSTTGLSTTTTTEPTPTSALTPVEPPPPTSSSGPTTTEPEHTGPPPATISGESGTVDMEQGSSCWDGLCADTIGPGDQTPAMAVTQGEELTVAWDTDLVPDDGNLYIDPVGEGAPFEKDLRAANPTSFVVDLEPGSYYVVVSALFEPGDTTSHIRLDVSV